MKNLTIENMTKACRGIYHGSDSLLGREAAHVVIDSRKAGPGDVFVAIKGERVDGHSFIPGVMEKGALCAVFHLSPASYMKPSIMAGSLLLRPFRTEEIREAFSEAFGNFFKEDEENEEENQFIIDNREGKWRIDLEHVYYFEAREKKLFLNDGVREIGFYDTLDNIRKKLPAWFVRCHRSFLINGRKIEKLLLGQNLVVLKDGWEIPVSRTYKKEIKEYVG